MEAISMIAMANDYLNHVRRNSIKPNLILCVHRRMLSRTI
jgi:hypothetical protein